MRPAVPGCSVVLGSWRECLAGAFVVDVHAPARHDDQRDQHHHDPGALGELGDRGDQHDRADSVAPRRLVTSAARHSALAVAQPVRDHPALGEREGEEHADREQRDQRRGPTAEGGVDHRRGDGEHKDAVGEREAITHAQEQSRRRSRRGP